MKQKHLRDDLVEPLFRMVGRELAKAGFGPKDTDVARILTAMLASHYKIAGGGEELKTALVALLIHNLNIADQLDPP